MKPRKPQHRNQPSPPSQPTQSISKLVRIEKPIYGGSFLTRDEGKAIFVPLVLAGEQARVRILENKGKRGYATAEVEEIVAAALERVTPGCMHFGVCGGCHYQHADYAGQLLIKTDVLRETLRRGGVSASDDIAVLSAEPWAYRNRIRLAFDAAGNPGYRARRSHAIIPIRECPIAAPLLVRAAMVVPEIARQFAPVMRMSELALFCDADEKSLLASVFVASPMKIDCAAFAKALQQQIPQLTGLEILLQPNDREPPRRLAQWGANSIRYRAAGYDYRVDHGAFFQVNRWLVDSLVERVTAGQRGSLAWDLFAGVGLFARKLSENFARVVAVESAPLATAALETNLDGTAGAAVALQTLEFLQRNRRDQHPDLIVVDPPRTGLGLDATTLLSEIAAPTLIYVSCDPATLARDLQALIANGYAIESITLADLFPQTFHIESIVHLRRN